MAPLPRTTTLLSVLVTLIAALTVQWEVSSNSGNSRWFADATDGALTIELFIDEIWKAKNGDWKACFGWDNPNSMTINIADADLNFMTQNGPPPTSFPTGRHTCQFDAVAPVEALGQENLAWHLTSLNNHTRVAEVRIQV